MYVSFVAVRNDVIYLKHFFEKLCLALVRRNINNEISPVNNKKNLGFTLANTNFLGSRVPLVEIQVSVSSK